MRKKRQRNVEYNVLNLNEVPSWRQKGQKKVRNDSIDSESESNETVAKKFKEEKFMEGFQNEMKQRLFKSIKDCIDSKSSLHDLKMLCLSKKRLDRGTITDAEERIGFRATEIQNY